jgi:aspartate racemase
VTKTLGLLGGMSWESSSEYYRLLNEAVRERLGGLHSAECVMWSVDFAAIEGLQREGRWDEAGELLARHARTLETAGAAALVLCTNTMHRLADQVQSAIDIPLLHIADATAARIRHAGVDTVGLIATR